MTHQALEELSES